MKYLILFLCFICCCVYGDVERTLSIIKPDAVERHLVGEIISRFEKNDLYVVAARMEHFTPEQVRGFYDVHKEKPFFDGLVEYMSSGPVMVMVLEGEDAIAKNREIMGATNPKNAAPGTIRWDFGQKLPRNTVHGSDAPETAKQEIDFFFGNE